MALEDRDAVRASATVNDFARSLSQHLPNRLSRLRQLGKATKALPRGKPKRPR